MLCTSPAMRGPFASSFAVTACTLLLSPVLRSPPDKGKCLFWGVFPHACCFWQQVFLLTFLWGSWGKLSTGIHPGLVAAKGSFTLQGAAGGHDRERRPTATPRGASPQQHPWLLSPSPRLPWASTPRAQCPDGLPGPLLALATLLYPSPGLGGALPTAQPFSRMWSCPGLNHFSFPFFNKSKKNKRADNHAGLVSSEHRETPERRFPAAELSPGTPGRDSFFGEQLRSCFMAPCLPQIHLLPRLSLRHKIPFSSRPLTPPSGCPRPRPAGLGAGAVRGAGGAEPALPVGAGPWAGAGAAGVGLSALSQRLHFPCPPSQDGLREVEGS